MMNEMILINENLVGENNNMSMKTLPVVRAKGRWTGQRSPSPLEAPEKAARTEQLFLSLSMYIYK